MEDRERTTKLLVVTDKAGNIVSAAWPGVESGDGPTATGVRLSDDQVAHEVDVPEELYQSDQPDLSGFRVEVGEGGPALTKG